MESRELTIYRPFGRQREPDFAKRFQARARAGNSTASQGQVHGMPVAVALWLGSWHASFPQMLFLGSVVSPSHAWWLEKVWGWRSQEEHRSKWRICPSPCLTTRGKEIGGDNPLATGDPQGFDTSLVSRFMLRPPRFWQKFGFSVYESIKLVRHIYHKANGATILPTDFNQLS